MSCKKCKCKVCSCIVNEQVKIAVNKVVQNPDEKGIVNIKVPTKTSDLINDSGFGQGGDGGGKIEEIRVNGVPAPIQGKIAIITVPTKTSDLTNDLNFVTKPYVDSHIINKNNPHNVTKEQLNLGNVDNTSDLNKPISTATQNALNTKLNTTDVKSEVIYQDLKPVNSIAIEKHSVKKINTISELRNTKGEYEDQIIQLLGYYNPGDKEPLNYKWSLTQGVDDGGSIINADNGSWLISLSNKELIHLSHWGILDNDNLDQTNNINNFIKYCDDKNIYEINFYNYSLLSPKYVHFITIRNSSINGILFKKPHKICNLKIKNDPTIPLQQGASLITFAPEGNGEGIIEFENVILDPKTDNHNIISGEADGHLFGIGFIGSYAPWSTLSRYEQTDYKAVFKNIQFKSIAWSYNVNLADIFLKETIIEDVSGEYLGLFFHTNSYNLEINNINGVFRDDIFNSEGRVLVTNLIHEEAEIIGFEINRNKLLIINSSCVKYSNNKEHTVYKQHTLGKINQKECIFDNIIGNIETFANTNDNVFNVDSLKILNHKIGNLEINNKVDYMYIYNSNTVSPNLLEYKSYNKIEIDSCTISKAINTQYNESVEINEFILNKCNTIINNDDFNISLYGLVNNENTLIKNIYIDKLDWKVWHFLNCKVQNITFNNSVMKQNLSTRFLMFNNLENEDVNVTFDNFIVASTMDGYLIERPNNCNVLINSFSSKLKESVNSVKTKFLNYVNSSPILKSDSDPIDNIYLGYEYFNTIDNSFKKYNGTTWS